MADEIDVKALWKELDIYEAELDKESNTLEDIWSQMIQMKQKNDIEADKLLSAEEFYFHEPSKVIVLNVGGQIFESTVSILTKDPYSILAACCRVHPHPQLIPHIDTDSGVIFIDRDWWLFRHIIAYLRSNILPNHLDTLKELYVEASFYRLGLLMKAIQEYPVNNIVSHS